MSHLTELSFVEKRGPHKYYLYHCDCGNEKVIRRSHVSSGRTRSCGCTQYDTLTNHGMWKTGTYRRWQDMKGRVTPSAARADRYNHRGISVCEEWKDFENFYKDMGECNGLELDRIDNNKGYCKSNCRWTSRTINMRNREALKGGSSKYIGVSWQASRSRWRAYININGKTHHIGMFKIEREAAIARDEVAKNYEGFTLNNVHNER